MKQFIEKSLGWLKYSNRPKHMIAGVLVFIAMLVVCLILRVTLTPSTLISFIATCIVAVAVDYKDKLWGGKFDWMDVAATVLVPGVITLLICIIL